MGKTPGRILVCLPERQADARMSATEPGRRAAHYSGDSTHGSLPSTSSVNPSVSPCSDWTPTPTPTPREPMAGRYCRLEPLQPAIHAAALYEANAGNDVRLDLTPSCGPFPSFGEAPEPGRIPFMRPMTPCSSRSSAQGRTGRSGQLPAHHAVGRFDRGRPSRISSPALQAVSGGHRGHVSDDGSGVPTGLPPLRVEM